MLPEEIYTENHHIIPRSLGGTNCIDNLVTLTAREHYIVHLLLVYFTEGQDRYKMLCAVRLLANDNKRNYNSRLYQKIKADYRDIMKLKMKGNVLGMLLKGRVGTFKNKKHTEGTKQILRERDYKWLKGKKQSKKHIEKRCPWMFDSTKNPQYGKPAWNKGKKNCYKKSVATKLKISHPVVYNNVWYYSIIEAARQNCTTEYKVKKKRHFLPGPFQCNN